MPGLVAIMAEPNQPELSQALDACLGALAYPGHQTARLVLSEMGVALGHTGPARVATPQPGHARDDQVATFLEGEPLEMPTFAHDLGLAPGATPAEVVAALYARHGTQGLEKLSGHWAIAVVDRAQHQVVLANDPFGVRPLYQMRAKDGALLVGSHPTALLAYPAAPRTIAPAGLADFLAFGYVLGTKTLFQEMLLLPPATLLTWNGGETSARRYWVPKPSPSRTLDVADLEALRQKFNDTVASTCAAGGPFCLALTGGRDSRTVLSAMLIAGIRPDTMTHTIPGAGDAQIGARLSKVAGVTHHFYEVRGEDLPPLIAPGIRMLGGQVASVDVHPLRFLDDLSDFTQVMFTGMGGDVIQMNYGVVQGAQRPTSMPQLIETTLRHYNRVLSLERDFPVLLSDDWFAALRDLPASSVAQAFASVSPDVPLAEKSGVFYIQERIRKFLAKGDAIVRRELETRHPFMTRDVMMEGWNLPMSARVAGVAHSYIVTRNAPALADVPFEMTGQPIRFPRTAIERWNQRCRAAWHAVCRRLGMRYQRVPNYRYADWIRGPLRPLFTDVLLDPRTQARPYFNQGTVRLWLDEHMAGHDHTLKLSALLSLELSIRSLLENDVD